MTLEINPDISFSYVIYVICLCLFFNLWDHVLLPLCSPLLLPHPPIFSSFISLKFRAYFLAVIMCTYVYTYWFLNITYLVYIKIAIFVSLELTIWYWISSWCILPWRRHSHSEYFSILGSHCSELKSSGIFIILFGISTGVVIVSV